MRAPKSFEDGMARLETILSQMQSEETTLTESVKLYAEAASLMEYCHAALEKASLQMEEIDAARREKAEAEENAKKLGAIQVKIAAKAGSNGKLFGSVTSKEISDALHEQFALTIEKQKIVQAEPIKSFGAYEVKCKLGYEVTGTIHVLVIEDK